MRVFLMTAILFIVAGCAGAPVPPTPVVVQAPQRYCPAPEQPQVLDFKEADVVLIKVKDSDYVAMPKERFDDLIANYLGLAEFAAKMKVMQECYETEVKTDGR